VLDGFTKKNENYASNLTGYGSAIDDDIKNTQSAGLKVLEMVMYKRSWNGLDDVAAADADDDGDDDFDVEGVCRLVEG
jgi:hypothetical protein